MRKRSSLLALVAVCLFSGGCRQYEENPFDLFPLSGEVITFQAIWGAGDHSPDTKTTLQNDGLTFWWEPTDEIMVFNRYYPWRNAHIDLMGRFKADVTIPAPTTTFSGSYSTSWTNDGWIQVNPTSGIIAVFPAQYGETIYEMDHPGELRFPVLIEQVGLTNDIDDNLFPAVARGTSDNGTLPFYHIFGGICFSVTKTGITRLCFRSNAGESLSGSVKIGFDGSGAIPIIQSVEHGVDSVVVSAPGFYFEPGMRYYAVLIPQILSQGISIRMTKKDNNGAIAFTDASIKRPLIVQRARFGLLEGIDNNASFKEE